MDLFSYRPDKFRPAIVDFESQREWRWLIAIAFYVGGLGCGAFIISLYFDFMPGMIAGFLITAVLKGGAHVFYLGHPLRAWRAFTRPHVSWISRGLIFVFGFSIFGFLYIIARLNLPFTLPWGEGTAL